MKKIITPVNLFGFFSYSRYIKLAAVFFLVLFCHDLFSGVHADCLSQVSPDPHKLLFWSPEEQICGYKRMEKLWPYYNNVSKGKAINPIPQGTPLPLAQKRITSFMEKNHVVGLLVLHHGTIRLDVYGDGFTAEDRWTSFSMAKSITGVLAGCALQDGYINSLDDPISKYLPELATGAYSTVTVQNLLEMTSGIDWNENYASPNSDVAQLNAIITKGGSNAFIKFMQSRQHKAPAGSFFRYSTGDSTLLGRVIAAATKKTLSTYLSEKIWSKADMEKDAFWITDPQHYEISGCCFSATLRDYGQFGLLLANKGSLHGEQLFSNRWFKQATTPSKQSIAQGGHYGHHLWIRQDGGIQASGIFGQGIYVYPDKGLVVVMLAAWPTATGNEALHSERADFLKDILTASTRLTH